MKDPFLEKLNEYCTGGVIEKKYHEIITDFYLSYFSEVPKSKKQIDLFLTFLELVKGQFISPFAFQPYHKKIIKPFDYYKFGIEFLLPLVEEGSKVIGLENLEKIKKQLSRHENIILFANHQTESDPQVISILLKNSYPDIASKIIYVAGERVISDPLAVPFSMGCDLLCIYSKKYIDHPLELKRKKQLHNKKTMEYMSQLLKEGEKIIYVAPSGGRDRPNSKGEIEVSPFDAQSIEMFYLMVKKSNTKSHFYPLSLLTYSLLPPPNNIQIELGEKRRTKKGKIFASFGSEIDMEHFPGDCAMDKSERRINRANYIFSKVKEGYDQLRSF